MDLKDRISTLRNLVYIYIYTYSDNFIWLNKVDLPDRKIKNDTIKMKYDI